MLKVELPLQATEFGNKFIKSSKENIKKAKKTLIGILIARIFLKTAMNQFFSSLAFLGFVSTDFGVSIAWPPVA